MRDDSGVTDAKFSLKCPKKLGGKRRKLRRWVGSRFLSNLAMG